MLLNAQMKPLLYPMRALPTVGYFLEPCPPISISWLPAAARPQLRRSAAKGCGPAPMRARSPPLLRSIRVPPSQAGVARSPRAGVLAAGIGYRALLRSRCKVGLAAGHQRRTRRSGPRAAQPPDRLIAAPLRSATTYASDPRSLSRTSRRGSPQGRCLGRWSSRSRHGRVR
jgi:hypothetical protein